jgi:uncharacterized protein
MLDVFQLFVFGVIGGVLAGLLGIGGGIIFLLILSMMLPSLGVSDSHIVQYQLANSMVGVFFATLSSSFSLIRLKQFYYKQVAIVAVGSVLSSYLFFHFVVDTSWFTKDKFSVIVLTILSYMFLKVIKSTNRIIQVKSMKSVSALKYFLTGIGGGMLAALSGLGGGVVMVPVFYGWFKLDYKVAKSISLGVISITALMLTIKNLTVSTEQLSLYHIGYVIPKVAGGLSLGVVLGGCFGVSIGQKISSKTTSVIYAVFLLIFIAKKVIELINGYNS